MGALFSRVKTWISTEDVVFSDLNDEFDNILDNLIPTMIDDFSANVTQMQTVADPGEVGTESLATSLSGEISRLRNIIKEITGEDQWYETPVVSLTGLNNAIGSTGLTANRLVSGRVRTDSDQPIFLVPNGAARTVKLDGTPTNFKYYIEGIEYTIDADVTLTGLTAAPSSNNTCLVNDTVAADQDWTKYAGEDGSEITIDTVGSEITSLIGKIAAFKLDNGSTTEIFIAEVGTNKLIKAKRGYFFDSADAPSARIVYSNNDTITLLKLTWIFAKTDETLTPTYTNPVWSYDEPSSPAANDYWFDYATTKWKRFDVSAFVDADATLVGVCCQDTTNTIGARSFEFFRDWDALNTIELFAESNTQVKSRWPGPTINVWGNAFVNERSFHTWDITADLDTGAEAASTFYFAYITEDGDRKLSVTRPYDRREDLLGYYHPHHSWRCVGVVFNNGSSNFSSVESFYNRYPNEMILPAQTAAYNIEVKDQVIPLDSSGGAFTQYLPPAAYCRGQKIIFVKTSSDANAITLDGFGSETINGVTTLTVAKQYEVLVLISDGTSWYRVSQTSKGHSISSSSGSFSSTSTTLVDVTNLSIAFTTRGGRIFAGLQSDGSGGGSSLAGNGDGAANNISAAFAILRDSTEIARVALAITAGGASVIQPLAIPPSSLWVIDDVVQGAYTYKVQALVGGGAGSPTVQVNLAKLVVYEI